MNNQQLLQQPVDFFELEDNLFDDESSCVESTDSESTDGDFDLDMAEEEDEASLHYTPQVESLQRQINVENAYTTAMACFPGFFYAVQTTTMSNNSYWTITHPGLDDSNLDSSYHNNYRMNSQTFNLIVSTLSQHPVYQSRDSAYIQIATILWHLANTHLGLSYQALLPNCEISFYET
ncbi:hypothetical protein BC941DRAFT_476884 [Chlamydoabsidia padenii]|nr:hypothetical protein BC941DRAFT_476884 [Chlamydoabsidia padenii]